MDNTIAVVKSASKALVVSIKDTKQPIIDTLKRSLQEKKKMSSPFVTTFFKNNQFLKIKIKNTTFEFLTIDYSF